MDSHRVIAKLNSRPNTLIPFSQIPIYINFTHKVFLVAGGFNSIEIDGTSSTETLVEGGLVWNFQDPLPLPTWGLRGVSLFNTIIMTGKIFTHVSNSLFEY